MLTDKQAKQLRFCHYATEDIMDLAKEKDIADIINLSNEEREVFDRVSARIHNALSKEGKL